MWKDSTKNRHERYKEILSGSDCLYEPAFLLEKESRYDPTQESMPGVVLNTSAYVLGPVMSAYVLWVLKNAMQRGKKRLYFLARDGYFMYVTAKMLCKKLNIPIDCRYLCCSRYSVRVPMFHLNMNEAFDYICRGGIDVTVDKIINRAGLSKEEKDKVCAEIDRKPDEVVPYSELKAVRKQLEASRDFAEFVNRRSEDKYPALEGYIKSQGLLDDTDFSFVDSGWVGSMQKVIATLINHMHQKEGDGKTFKPDGYYFGLYELPADVNPEDYHCYYFSERKGVRRKIGFSNCLFESIFSAPHGMTLWYEEREGAFKPVFAQIRQENKRFILRTEKYIRGYASALAEGLLLKATDSNGIAYVDSDKERGIIEKLLNIFMGSPTYGEALCYGRLPFSDDVLDENEQETAAPLTQEELKSNHPWNKVRIMTGLAKGKVKESAWYEGSAVRGRENVGHHLRAYAGYKWLLYAKKELSRRLRKI